MVSQHSTKWQEYDKILKDEESITKFFDTRVAFVNRLDSHPTGQSQTFKIHKDIIEILIGEMLFDENDEDEQMTKERVLKMFTMKPMEDIYTYKIKNLHLFHLCLQFIACGSSICLTSRLVNATKEETSLAYLSGRNEAKIWQYVRAMVGISLQNITNIMQGARTYSIALNSSTHQSYSYLDIRLRVYHKKTLQNYHLLALPMYDRHTGQYMFQILSKLLDVLDPE